MWAEAVVRQVKRVREVRRKAHSLGRSYERMDGEWSADALDLARCFREQWAEEQALVWRLTRWSGGPGGWQRSGARNRHLATRCSRTSGTPLSTGTRPSSKAITLCQGTGAGP